MTIPIKNHEYLIADNIAYHMSLGIDAFVVFVHNSTDKSLEIVQSFRDKVDIVIEEVSDPVFKDAEFRTRMAHIAKEKLDADWVISNDVDEFWLINDGVDASLKTLLTQEEITNVVYVHRYNMLPFPEDAVKSGSSIPSTYTHAITNPRKIDKTLPFSEITPLDYLIKTCAGKAATATIGLHAIGHGSHEIEIGAHNSRIEHNLTIFHYPFTTQETFLKETKDKVRSVLSDSSLRKDQNWHVKLLEYLVTHNKLEEFADGLFLKEKGVEALVSAGYIENRSEVSSFFMKEGSI